MSTPNKRGSVSGSRCSAGPIGAVVELLDGWIGQLEVRERAAVKKGDWPAARFAVIEKAKLKEAQHQATAGSRRRA